MFDKHFTVDEAQAALPVVREALEKILRLRDELGVRSEEIEALIASADGNGGGKKSGPYLDLVLEVHALVSDLNARGILIKNFDVGLVDFPHLKDGREVFLCWQKEEESILYWHELDGGFAGRRPL